MGAPQSNVQSIAGTRFPSHQLSNGLYVSGHPDLHKERGPTMSVPQTPYTGGDVKKSGELGKMFDIPVEGTVSAKLRKSGSYTSASKVSNGGASSSHSGPLHSEGSFQNPNSACGPVNSGGISKQALKPGVQVSKSGPLMGTTVVTTRQSSNSGPLSRNAINDPPSLGSLKTSQSGSGLKTAGNFSTVPTTYKCSGLIAPTLPTTGLITSGPISAGPVSTTIVCNSGQSGPLDTSGASGKASIVAGSFSPAINKLSYAQESSFRKSLPKVVLWTVVPLFVMGFIAGGFIIAAVQNAVLLIVVASIFTAVVVLLMWNTCWGRRSITEFLAKYPDSELGTAKDGQYVKVTGVVTCGSVPLESSYQKVNRCMYTSTGLYEYRSLFSKPAREKHLWFTWGLRHLERHVVDFYISDFQTGLRALVKAGYGARVTSHVDESPVVDITPKVNELPSDFLRWLTERKLSSDDRIMRLKEGYIKEGSTVTVWGVVQRHENVLMIVPPSEVVSTGCQWAKLLLPANLEGIILACDKITRNEGVPL